MTDGLVDCFNCGRPNPEWAQVCRACGVPLRHGGDAAVPSRRIPTDRASVTSIAAVLGSIVFAVALGLLLSSLNPTEPTVGREVASPTSTASPTEEATRRPSTPSAAPTESIAPSASAAAAPGTITFGTSLEGESVAGATDTFARGTTFAHAISVPEPFGVNSVGEQVVRIADDGTEEEVVRAVDNQLTVLPEATAAGFEAPSDVLFDALGPGNYILRAYAGTTLLAEGRFTLAES